MKHLELGPAKQSFIGVWRLESYTEASNPPSCEPPFGADASGILIYTGDGWVSAQLTIPNRQLPGSGAEDSATCGQSEDLGSGYLAYCGRYHLDLEHSEVIHVPEVASLLGLVKQPQRRRFVFVAEDRLQLTAESVLVDGKALSTHVTWRRSIPSFYESEAAVD